MSRSFAREIYVAESLPIETLRARAESSAKRRGAVGRWTGSFMDETAGTVGGYVLTLAILACVCAGAAAMMGRAFESQYRLIGEDGREVVPTRRF